MTAADDPVVLKSRIADLEAQVAVLLRENERLEDDVTQLRHRAFGRSSEKLDPTQFSLFALAQAAGPPPEPKP